MSSFNRRGLIAGLTVALSVGVLGCSAHTQEVVYVPTAPPAPRVEVVPTLPAERVDEAWQPGYWRWTGSEYVWVSGHYVSTPRRGAVWIPGRWERQPRGWVYNEGHWG
jgi:hypothetical protein